MADVKIVVDCSTPDPERLQQLVASEAATIVELARTGQIAQDAAAAKLTRLAEAASALGQLPAQVSVVPLTEEELAQREADAAAHAAELEAQRQAALIADRAKRDRYLAQTDWIMLPATARPIDMDPAIAAAVDENQQAWADWRALLRARYDDPAFDPLNPPPFPAQPAAPALRLT